jgi:hypothetical protein
MDLSFMSVRRGGLEELKNNHIWFRTKRFFHLFNLSWLHYDDSNIMRDLNFLSLFCLCTYVKSEACYVILFCELDGHFRGGQSGAKRVK